MASQATDSRKAVSRPPGYHAPRWSPKPNRPQAIIQVGQTKGASWGQGRQSKEPSEVDAWLGSRGVRLTGGACGFDGEVGPRSVAKERENSSRIEARALPRLWLSGREGASRTVIFWVRWTIHLVLISRTSRPRWEQGFGFPGSSMILW